jgi:hypothetical protein
MKRLMKRRPPIVALLCAAGLILPAVVAGCLDADVRNLARYDAQKDQFTFLNLYQDISGQKPADLEHLHALWRNRGHIIDPPTPNILGKMAYLRLSPTRFATMNLGQPTESLASGDSPVPLDRIEVRPGKFFLTDPQTLCYYDQTVVPGEVVDQLLPVLHKALVESMATGAAEERERRAAGGRPGDWAEATREAVDDVRGVEKPDKPEAPPPPEGQDAAADEPDGDEPISLFDEESLALWEKAAEPGAVTLAREGRVFRVTMPLSDADLRRADAMLKAIREAVEAEVAKPDHALAADQSKAAMDVLKIDTSKPRTLAVAADLVAVFDAADRLAAAEAADVEPAAPQEPGAVNNSQKTIAFLRQRGVPLDEKTTVEQVRKGFGDGTLPSFPPAGADASVKPGEGLGTVE